MKPKLHIFPSIAQLYKIKQSKNQVDLCLKQKRMFHKETARAWKNQRNTWEKRPLSYKKLEK